MKSIDSIAKNTPKEYRLVTLLVDPMQINDALQRYPDCPTEVKQWAMSAIVWVVKGAMWYLFWYIWRSWGLIGIIQLVRYKNDFFPSQMFCQTIYFCRYKYESYFAILCSFYCPLKLMTCWSSPVFFFFFNPSNPRKFLPLVQPLWSPRSLKPRHPVVY